MQEKQQAVAVGRRGKEELSELKPLVGSCRAADPGALDQPDLVSAEKVKSCMRAAGPRRPC